jgi:hypothetical protein
LFLFEDGEVMTRLFVDAQEIAPPPSVFSSLDNVIRHVEENHLPPDSVIRRIQVDGVPFEASESAAACGTPVPPLPSRQKVEIFTGTLRDVASDSIDEAVLYLERIEAVSHSLVSGFRSGPGPQAFGNLRQLYEGFYWMNLLIDRLRKSFGIRLEGITIRGESAQEHYNRFLSVLKQMVAAHERQDFIFVADLLEYEILPIVPIWKEMFKALEEFC